MLGGGGLVMFGMVAATGVRILSGVDYATNKHNLYIVAISLGVGMIPLVAPRFFQYMPKALGPLLHSGILLAAIMAVVLNLFFNGRALAGRGRGRCRSLVARVRVRWLRRAAVRDLR